MKKSLQICAALIAAAISSLTASAADGFFARAGAAWFEPVEDDFLDGELGVLVAVGRQFGAHSVEIETGRVELGRSFGGGAEINLEIIPVTAGYFYTLDLGNKLSLALGANTGIAVTNFEISVPGASADDDDTVWIASGIARLGYTLTDKVSLTAGYRYVYVDTLEYFGGLSLKDNDTHVIELGVDVRF
jgi:hypothetical protein